jgi:antitoxin (DNA-binding transcriptional repressor) of toxin-antitoxin stability system
VKKVSIVAQAAAGEVVQITKHRRAVAQIAPVTSVRVGIDFGRPRLKPVLRGGTRGRYLDFLADDRRGGGERP